MAQSATRRPAPVASITTSGTTCKSARSIKYSPPRSLTSRAFGPSAYREVVGLLRALDDDPQIVICDYTMPTMTAPDALAILRERAPDLPLIVVSGTMDEATTRLAADFANLDKNQGVPSVPILMFIDRQGVVQIQVFGDSAFFQQFGVATRAALNSMLHSK